MGRPPFPRPGVGGFTLLEVMMALAIAALLLTGVYTVLSGGVSRSRALAREALLQQRAQAVLGLLVSDLAAAFVPPEQGTYPFFEVEHGYQGDRHADRLDLLTVAALPFDPSAPSGDLGEVGYRLSFGGEKSGTLYRREEVPPRDPDGEGGESVTACRGVLGLEVRCSDGRDWYDDWDAADSASAWSRGKVPREVEVSLTLAGEGESGALTLRTRVEVPMRGAE